MLGQLHPLLVHFPIALVIVAFAAEVLATARNSGRWRAVAVANIRLGAGVAVVAALAGWRLALASNGHTTSILEWHRWLGVMATGATIAAALAASGAERRFLPALWIYRITLFVAASLVAVTGHVGGLMVWGADFWHL
jgi:uncharacterized membrane protein